MNERRAHSTAAAHHPQHLLALVAVGFFGDGLAARRAYALPSRKRTAFADVRERQFRHPLCRHVFHRDRREILGHERSVVPTSLVDLSDDLNAPRVRRSGGDRIDPNERSVGAISEPVG